VDDHDRRCEQLGHLFADTQDVIFLGRGINYPIALEGALKLKEISYIHAEGYPAGEMKHGPIALLDARVPVVSIAVPGAVFDKVLSNAQEAKARDAQLIGVAPEYADAELFDTLLPVPVVDELLSPLLTVIPMQLLSYHIAAHRGLDVDQPRNLAKSVTVERASPWSSSRCRRLGAFSRLLAKITTSIRNPKLSDDHPPLRHDSSHVDC